MLDSDDGDQDEPPADLEAARGARFALKAGGAGAGDRGLEPRQHNSRASTFFAAVCERAKFKFITDGRIQGSRGGDISHAAVLLVRRATPPQGLNPWEAGWLRERMSVPKWE